MLEGIFGVTLFRESKSKLHWSIGSAPMVEMQLEMGIWLFEIFLKLLLLQCGIIGSLSMAGVRGLEFIEGATFWTLVFEMLNVGQFYSCIHSVLQWGCRLFLSAFFFEDCVPCLLANMHVENIDECLCQCMLFVVGHACGDVVCVIKLGSSWNHSLWVR